MQGGAERLELHKPVHQRLNLGLITFSSALMAVMSVNLELLRPWALVIGSAECSAAATIPAFFYAVTSGHYLQPVQILKARPAFNLPRFLLYPQSSQLTRLGAWLQFL